MKIKIGYKEYEIIKKDEVIDLPDELYGKIDYDNEKITISNKFSQKQQNQTFIHELLHGIAEKQDLAIRKDEHVIQLLSIGLYEVIKDNPDIFTMKDI